MAHVHLGLGLFLFCALLLRNRRNGLFLAWAILAVLQGFNELVDAWGWNNYGKPVNWPDAISDFGATLFWPTILLFALRWIGPTR